MKVQIAQTGDVNSWLTLAAEVENLFGPMINEPRFMGALERNIERGSAFCIREGNGPPGAPLLAGILFSAKPPAYKVAWLAVAERRRRHGLGSALLAHVMEMVRRPAEVTVTTFSAEVEGGAAARQFYLAAGFEPAEMTLEGPEGGLRQIFRKKAY